MSVSQPAPRIDFDLLKGLSSAPLSKGMKGRGKEYLEKLSNTFASMTLQGERTEQLKEVLDSIRTRLRQDKSKSGKKIRQLTTTILKQIETKKYQESFQVFQFAAEKAKPKAAKLRLQKERREKFQVSKEPKEQLQKVQKKIQSMQSQLKSHQERL